MMGRFVPGLLLMMVISGSALADPLPYSWRMSMTEAPETNPILKKFGAPIDDKLLQHHRQLTLILLMWHGCEPKIDDTKLKAWEKENLKTTYTKEEISEARKTVLSEFHGVDKQSVAQACAGWRTLFGPNGHLLPGLVTKTAPLKDNLYIVGDPNPYVRLHFQD